MRSIRGKLTYANVMATIAVFGMLAGGGAYAASKIGPEDIKTNAVRTKHVKNRVVTPAKLSPRVHRVVAWARIRVSGGDAVIADQSGGITIQPPVSLGVHHLKLGRKVDGAAVIATHLSDGGAARHIEAAVCSHPGASCQDDAEGSPRAVKIVTTDMAGNPLVTPTPYYVAIVK